jgi:hypothetical protein
MRSKHINVGPDGSRERVVLKVCINDTNAVTAEFSAPQVEDFMEKIAFARAALKEEVVADLVPTARMKLTEIDPVWRASAETAEFDAEIDGILLALRHTGYGWLSFILPHKEARALGQWLVENAPEA